MTEKGARVDLAERYMGRYLFWREEGVAEVEHRNPVHERSAMTAPEHEEIEDLVDCALNEWDPSDSWNLICELVSIAPDDGALRWIGAGLFEDWVAIGKAEVMRQEIIQSLQADERMRTMLRASWSLPASVAVALAKWVE